MESLDWTRCTGSVDWSDDPYLCACAVSALEQPRGEEHLQESRPTVIRFNPTVAMALRGGSKSDPMCIDSSPGP